MWYLLFLIIYILSFISLRYSHRLCSSKHYRIYTNKDCVFQLGWIIPIINTFGAIFHWSFIIPDILEKNKNLKQQKNNSIIDKILNTDLL